MRSDIAERFIRYEPAHLYRPLAQILAAKGEQGAWPAPFPELISKALKQALRLTFHERENTPLFIEGEKAPTGGKTD